MATHTKQIKQEIFYFITFTCYKWLPLIEKSNLYEYIKAWAEELSVRGIKISGYVIMPNHIHLLVYVDKSCKGLSLVMGEAKRFMAYEIVKRLTILKKGALLKTLSAGVQKEERVKGKKHQVFRLSFDGKEVLGEVDILQVLEYIHQNPVSKKWQLAEAFTDYPYSSAKYYNEGKDGFLNVWDYRNIYQE
jgi:REP element-mobilizing transposase RayT